LEQNISKQREKVVLKRQIFSWFFDWTTTTHTRYKRKKTKQELLEKKVLM